MSRGRRSADQPQPDPVVAAADVVDQQPRRAVVVADQHVDVAVVVDVAERRAAADLRQLEHRAGRARVTSSNRPLPRLRNSCFRWCSGNGSLRLRSASIVWTAPLTVRMSSQPSLSKSNQAVPKPV